jgi:hypothetical protein
MACYHSPRRRLLNAIAFSFRASQHPRRFSAPSTTQPHSRWLSDLKARLGKCIIFGLPTEQIEQAARIAKILGEEWRGLVAGREGYVIVYHWLKSLGLRGHSTLRTDGCALIQQRVCTGCDGELETLHER